VIRLALGDLQVTVLDAGTFWLDGGAMFGIVPKTIWEKERPCDARNRILLSMNVLLVEDGKERVLIDTGAGTKWDEKSIGIYGLEPKGAQEMLSPAGVTPEQIDVVVNSHLHFDHAGGNTIRDATGRFVPAFPNASYVVQRGEFELASNRSNERIRASYLPENFEALAADGRFRFVDGDTALANHLHVRLAPGHTPYMQVPLVVTPEATVAFLADLVPTASHVPFPYIMAYDLEPLSTLATKKRLLAEAAREGWYVVFEHDREIPMGILEEQGGRLKARPVKGGL